MALIKCPDCGGQVSDAAASCPSCSRPIEPVQLQVKGIPGASVLLKVLAVVLILLLVFLVLIVVQALDHVGRPLAIGRPVWPPMLYSRIAPRPVSTAVTLVLGLGVVGLAIYLGRKKGTGQAAK